MSVSNENVKETYNGNGLTIYWPITFEYSDPDHVAVYLTNLSGVTGDKLTSDYTVDEENERVIYPDPLNEELILPTGWKITLIRETPLTQEITISTQSFNPAVIANGLDKVTMAVAEIAEKNDRAVKRSISDTTDYTLPTAEAAKVLGWNSTGDGLINYTNPGAAVAEAEAFADAAEESATDAAASELAAALSESNAADSALAAAALASEMENIISTGWVQISGVWSYESANSVSEPGNQTTRNQIADKIKFTQATGGTKYDNLVSVTYDSENDKTIFTLCGHATVANEAITNPCYAKSFNPQGFPIIFNAALNKVAVRNTVSESHVDASNLPDFLAVGTGLAVNITAPLKLTFAVGFDNCGNQVDYNAAFLTDQTAFWSSLPANKTLQLFVNLNLSTGALTGVYSELFYIATKPAAATLDQHWLDVGNTWKMYRGNGTTWDQVVRVPVGECVTDADSVTSVKSYALKGKYTSGRFAIGNSTLYAKEHNLGVEPAIWRTAGATTNGGVLQEFLNVSTAAYYGAWVSSLDKNTIVLATGAIPLVCNGVSGDSYTAVEASITCDRGF